MSQISMIVSVILIKGGKTIASLIQSVVESQKGFRSSYPLKYVNIKLETRHELGGY